MKAYEASATIRATPDTIWEILTDGLVRHVGQRRRGRRGQDPAG